MFKKTVGLFPSVCVSTIEGGSKLIEFGRGSALLSKNPIIRSRDESMLVKSSANVGGNFGVVVVGGGGGDLVVVVLSPSLAL